MIKNLHKWVSLTSQSTTLLVIDMQVDFCSPNGFAARRGKGLKHMQNIITPLDDFARTLFKTGTLVIYTKFISGKGITPDNLRKAVLKEGFRFPCEKGSGGEDLYGLTLPHGATLIEKPHYDAFAHTRLKEILSKRKIKNVLVTGVRSEMCVDATAKRAASEGFDTFIISDLVATYDDKKTVHDEVLKTFNDYYGFVVDRQTILNLLENAK